LQEKRRKKTKMISLRVTEDQFEYLDQMAKRIKQRTGFRVTRASIILRLMQFGAPFLNREFPKQTDKEEAS
jgi:phenylalanine-4-hydroxylase